jgi:hypothetical protein
VSRNRRDRVWCRRRSIDSRAASGVGFSFGSAGHVIAGSGSVRSCGPSAAVSPFGARGLGIGVSVARSVTSPRAKPGSAIGRPTLL